MMLGIVQRPGHLTGSIPKTPKGTAVTGLASGTYFWRVAANGTCSGAASTAFTFSVSSGIFNDGFEHGNTNEWSAVFP